MTTTKERIAAIDAEFPIAAERDQAKAELLDLIADLNRELRQRIEPDAVTWNHVSDMRFAVKMLDSVVSQFARGRLKS